MDDLHAPSNAELIRHALGRDPRLRRRAEAQITELCEPYIRYAVYRVLTRSRDEALHDEATQAALLALIEALPRYRHSASLTSYAYAIAFNQASRILNNELRHARMAEAQLQFGVHLMPIEPTPEKIIQDRQLLSCMLGALDDELTTQEHQVFVALFLENRTVAEVAVLAGRSEALVRTVRHNIRRKARAIHGHLIASPPIADSEARHLRG